MANERNPPRRLVLGDYIVHDTERDRLGQGGMGIVYRAEHGVMGRTVALKVMSPELMRSRDAVARFRREIQAVARLNHPNIVVAYDAGQADGQHFLVMEYVAGTNLHDLVGQQGALPIERAVDYVRQAARGLQHAHAQGILHRDVKPANLLLDDTGTVKILDLGLAHFVGEARSELTQLGSAMGTADYMAPEQFTEPTNVDQRADVYSLGCTLFYLLAGKSPYDEYIPHAKAHAHHHQPIPPLDPLRGSVPPTLEALYQRMLAKDPKDRPNSMTEVLAALVQLSSGPVAATDESRGARPAAETALGPAERAGLTSISGPSVSRPKRSWLSWGLIVTLCLVAVAVAISLRQQHPRDPGLPEGAVPRDITPLPQDPERQPQASDEGKLPVDPQPEPNNADAPAVAASTPNPCCWQR